MAITIYGDSTQYGDADATYGRISAALATAQVKKVRETGIKIRIFDEQLNKWNHVAGVQTTSDTWLPLQLYAPLDTGLKSYDIEWSSFRAGHGMAVLGNGNIMRVRLGDPTSSTDRQIWSQIITDPTIAAQWTSWSVLYSGTHYSAVLQSDGTASGFYVFHSKSDGMYRNNVKQVDNSFFTGTTYAIKALSFMPVMDLPNAGWIFAIGRHFLDGRRFISMWYTSDLGSVNPSFEDFNYNYLTPFVTGIKIPDEDRIMFIVDAPIYTDPRSNLQGSVTSVGFKEISTGVNSPLYPIRGVGGGGGINYGPIRSILKLSDGFYYAFGIEAHQNIIKNTEGPDPASNLGFGIAYWMRSKDMYHWSEPVLGPPVKNSWGLAQAVPIGSTLYWADSEVVYQRGTERLEYAIENYVPQLQFELPRDNQPGTGQMVVANPIEEDNSFLLDLTDNPLEISLGIKTESGTYELVQYDQFFVKSASRDTKGAASRINLAFGNIWDRLDVAFRDVTNFIGRFTWDDFRPGGRNQKFNYFFRSDTAPVLIPSNSRLRTRGVVLLTAWKGHNPDIEAQFSSVTGTPTLLVRYVDEKNYEYLRVDGSALHYRQMVSGTDSLIDSWSVAADNSPKLRIRLRWGRYDVWYNTVYQGGGTRRETVGDQGYVGFKATSYDVGYIHVEDYEQDITIADLIKTALAKGDFHDALVSDAGTKAYATIWGPQTDLPTLSEALRNSLEAERLQLIWRNGSVTVGKFNDTTPIKTIQDTVIESEEVEETNRRINIASVDGNEYFWIEVDNDDAKLRGRMITSYLDIPELLDVAAVSERAREEIRRSAMGSSPGGTTPLYFDLGRMDTVTWIDNQGVEKLVRIEGFSVDINQSTNPHQRQTFDLAEYIVGSDGGLIIDPGDTSS